MRVRRPVMLFLLVCVAGTLCGCMSVVNYPYAPSIQRIDKDLQLEVDTYPADYGRDGFHIPFLYLHTHTADHVLFQVYLRNSRDTIYNSSKGIESMQITGFAYQFPEEDRIDLITAANPVSGNFWQQREDPLPFREGVPVKVWLTFVLNGERHTVQCAMKGSSSISGPWPLILTLWAT